MALGRALLQDPLPRRRRPLLAEEIDVNGARAGKVRRLGDKLSIRRGPYEWTVVVKGWQNFAALLLKRNFSMGNGRKYPEAGNGVRATQARTPPEFHSRAARLKRTGAPY